MPSVIPKLSKDREEILLKFKELIDKADAACELWSQSEDGKLPGDVYYELRVSSINLLTQVTQQTAFLIAPGPI